MGQKFLEIVLELGYRLFTIMFVKGQLPRRNRVTKHDEHQRKQLPLRQANGGSSWERHHRLQPKGAREGAVVTILLTQQHPKLGHATMKPSRLEERFGG